MNGLDVQIFAYCERGLNPAFWAEPLNAVSNAGFFIAAAIASVALWRQPTRQPVQQSGRLIAGASAELALIGLVAVIGTGSFLFHTFATRWAAIADGAPIAIFMLAYTGYALRRYLGWPWWAAAAGLGLFLTLLAAAAAAPCPITLRSLVRGSGCLNGSFAYLPALATLGLVAAASAWRGSQASAYLIAATAAFAVSLAMRSLDQQVCAATQLWGQTRGTHALWHLLNSVTLGLLLLAAVRHGRRTGGAR